MDSRIYDTAEETTTKILGIMAKDCLNTFQTAFYSNSFASCPVETIASAPGLLPLHIDLSGMFGNFDNGFS